LTGAQGYRRTGVESLEPSGWGPGWLKGGWPHVLRLWLSKPVFDIAVSGFRSKIGQFRTSPDLVVSTPENFARWRYAQASLLRSPATTSGKISQKRVGIGKGDRLDLKQRLDFKDPIATREWLVANIKGMGYKEASHFLRNIGLGKGLAILDVHILKNLKRYGVLKKMPASLTKKTYLEIEEKMRRFSKKIGIPLEELDLLLWASETGFIFK